MHDKIKIRSQTWTNIERTITKYTDRIGYAHGTSTAPAVCPQIVLPWLRPVGRVPSADCPSRCARSTIPERTKTKQKRLGSRLRASRDVIVRDCTAMQSRMPGRPVPYRVRPPAPPPNWCNHRWSLAWGAQRDDSCPVPPAADRSPCTRFPDYWSGKEQTD